MSDPASLPSAPSFMDGLPLSQAAFSFARERHREDRRDADGAPFILHPLEVAQILARGGYPDSVVAAGVLHDILEKTGVTFEEIEHRFGRDVAQLVRTVSDPPGGGPWATRKARLRAQVGAAGADAAALFAADKLSKVREVRLAMLGDAPPGETELEHYRESLAMLRGRLGHHPFVVDLAFELEALALVPPRVTTARGAT